MRLADRQIGGVRFNFTADVRREALNYRMLVGAPNPETAPQTPPPAEVSPFGTEEEAANGVPDAAQETPAAPAN